MVKDTAVHTCPICGFRSRRPLIAGPLGTCYRCTNRTRHVAASEGVLAGHSLCDDSPVYDQADEDCPDCPVCASTADTGIDPLRRMDMVLLSMAVDPCPAPDRWTGLSGSHTLWATEHGRRVVRDGYLTLSDDGRAVEATSRGRELHAAYLAAVRGGGQPTANHTIAIAVALRAIAPVPA